MFSVRGYMFSVQKHMFPVQKHMFPRLKHKMPKGEDTICQAQTGKKKEGNNFYEIVRT